MGKERIQSKNVTFFLTDRGDKKPGNTSARTPVLFLHAFQINAADGTGCVRLEPPFDALWVELVEAREGHHCFCFLVFAETDRAAVLVVLGLVERNQREAVQHARRQPDLDVLEEREALLVAHAVDVRLPRNDAGDHESGLVGQQRSKDGAVCRVQVLVLVLEARHSVRKHVAVAEGRDAPLPTPAPLCPREEHAIIVTVVAVAAITIVFAVIIVTVAVAVTVAVFLGEIPARNGAMNGGPVGGAACRRHAVVVAAVDGRRRALRDRARVRRVEAEAGLDRGCRRGGRGAREAGVLVAVGGREGDRDGRREALRAALLALEREGEEAVLLHLRAGAARGSGVGGREGAHAALGGRECDALVDGAAQDGRERAAEVEVGVLELVRERDERVALVRAEAVVQVRRGRAAGPGAPPAQQRVDVLDAAAHLAVQTAPRLVLHLEGWQVVAPVFTGNETEKKKKKNVAIKSCAGSPSFSHNLWNQFISCFVVLDAFCVFCFGKTHLSLFLQCFFGFVFSKMSHFPCMCVSQDIFLVLLMCFLFLSDVFCVFSPSVF